VEPESAVMVLKSVLLFVIAAVSLVGVGLIMYGPR
jgi:hypothetical protein